MSTAHTDERQMIADSVRRWSNQACTQPLRAASSAHGSGCPDARWEMLAEMGWTAFPIPEDDQGLGGRFEDICLIAEELGRGLLIEPFVASAVMASHLMIAAAQEPLRSEWLPAMAAGERRLAFAAWEPGCEGAVFNPQVTARSQSGQWLLTGAKGRSPGLEGADGVLLTATLDNQAGYWGIFLLTPETPGARIHNERLYDGRHAARLQLENAAAVLVHSAGADSIRAMVQATVDRGLIAHCAETAGTAAAAFDITHEYLQMRKQFGRAISSNQIIQHRLVDLYVEIEEVKALWRATAASPMPRNVAALAIRTCDLARHVWEEAVQLHGAIGMTEEYALGEYVRRLALASSLHGAMHVHQERLAGLSLSTQPGQ
ncbi:Acyl-CoA dehydrogenase [Paraburkholderia caffeinitolerans]|uniref:Acyl-CoA dehydrogenase n=1 Tax=Paraburkholderia caffeinitolerans TaxID=1723730 RepID=A0A6J5FUV1_9BURK|nr:acyl-CoA dehydrogenase family protein [Paraburkholderia caffeinitolerans]CAB3785286.1 Acyl-CoA dehydrogenase [Paraburkholderia caffeinitolerans]